MKKRRYQPELSLSSSTILLFSFLIPAIVFRFAVYANSIVKRPLGAGNLIHVTVGILTLSVMIQIASFLVFWLITLGASIVFKYGLQIAITEFDEQIFIYYNNIKFTFTKFILEHHVISLAYLVIVLLTSLISAWLFTSLAKRYMPIGRLLYGQLAPILVGPGSPILPCFVLTKICHENRRVVYNGFVKEVALKDGSNIDHIVLVNAEKFDFRMNKTGIVTTYDKSKPISRLTNASGFLYISGDDIENVHFDQFYLESKDFRLHD